MLLAETLLAAETASAGINWHSFFFLLFALVSCIGALAVLFSNNIVRMAFYLVISLGAVSGLFFLAGAQFVGAMQLMIYVGGTLVLLIFGVMLTAQDAFITMKSTGAEWLLGIIVGGSLLAVLVQTAFRVEDWRTPLTAEKQDEVTATYDRETTKIGLALVNVRTDEDERGNIPPGYMLFFELISIHLLVVLVGAAYLARTKTRLGGGETEAQPAKVSEGKRRPWWVTILLSLGIVGALVSAATLLLAPGAVEEQLPAGFALDDWLITAVGVIALIKAFLLIALLNWQKWAFYALVILALAGGAVFYFAGTGIGPAVGIVVSSLVGLAVLYGLFRIGKENSYWAQLD